MGSYGTNLPNAEIPKQPFGPPKTFSFSGELLDFQCILWLIHEVVNIVYRLINHTMYLNLRLAYTLNKCIYPNFFPMIPMYTMSMKKISYMKTMSDTNLLFWWKY